jgi:hypothetical protein
VWLAVVIALLALADAAASLAMRSYSARVEEGWQYLRHGRNLRAAFRSVRGRHHGYSPARNVNVTSCALSLAPTFVIARTAWVFTVNGDTDI